MLHSVSFDNIDWKWNKEKKKKNASFGNEEIRVSKLLFVPSGESKLVHKVSSIDKYNTGSNVLHATED